MPRSKGQKSGTGRKNVLNMMGYDDDEDDDDDGMEAELAAILGQSQSTKPKKKSGPKLLDWSMIDAQVASSMRDVDEDGDEDINEEDENDLMGELNDLIEEDQPALLKPTPAYSQARTPSPQPSSAGSTLQVLQDRKKQYEIAIENAKASGQSSKVRRLQRGTTTLNGLLRKAKAGKQVSEDEIPPMVATGQPATANEQSSAVGSAPLINIIQTPDPNPPSQISLSPTNNAPAPLAVEVDRPSHSTANDATVDNATLTLLQSRQHEYRDAALAAKRSGNKEDALKYFRVLKQFDPVLDAARKGQAVDLSKLPPSLKAENIPIQATASTQSEASHPPPATPEPAAPSSSQPPALTRPKTVLEALEQRMAKYQSSSDEAAKEGNGGKARRMGRIVKQYKDAIRSHKAGRPVNIDELPVPPGYPPIPGVNEVDRSENLMQKASALLKPDEDEDPNSSASFSNQLSPPTTSRRSSSPQKIGDHSASSNQQKRTSKNPPSAYEQQVSFLVNRQAAFKRAALDAKKHGDKTAAIEYLRKMKGFDNMIEAARNGLKVDITKVPQPPAKFVSPPRPSRDDGYDVIEEYEVTSGRGKSNTSVRNSPAEDDALFSRILESLEEQVKKARAFAQQMTHSGDVSGAERADRLSASSQVDLDYVRSCRRHGDPPPRFFYQDEIFKMIRMNPDIGSDEMELTIVQCMDMRVPKDTKIFIDIEFPFPHDNPITSKTEEGKGVPNLKFPGANFRVPFTRKLKSNHRAIKNKSVKLEAMQKGGIFRGPKSLGSTSIKLNPLEAHSEIHAIEELKDGRNMIGKIEAYVKLRTPLLSSDSQTIKERWIVVEHVKRSRPAPAPLPSATRSSSAKSDSTSSRKATSATSIAALPVLELDLKIANARIAECAKKGRSSEQYQKEARSIQEKMKMTKTYLREGGAHAQSEYINCLQQHYQHLHSEAQAYAKQGKREQAKLALSKRTMVKTELEKYRSRKS